jgi:hypothetical protein
MQALFMNLVPPSSHLFFNSGPKKALSHHKTDKKECLQLWHQSQGNYPTKTLNNSAKLGNSPTSLELFFAGFEEVFMGSDYGKLKCYGFELCE